uniref:LRRNT domain-containing protein n=1 Tax=Capitella teleta TaxID=283909 RepID=X2B4Y8_CAPTE
MKTIPTNIPKDTVGLYLANNSISTIATTDLSGLTKLENFYIPRNSLTTVEDGSFADLRSLTAMVLSENRLKKFPD